MNNDAVRSPWRPALAAGFGTAIEYYDFQLYAVLALTLSPLFFSSADPAAALLSTLGVFAVAFITRPLGGIFFGWYGDRNGRTAALTVTIVGTGAACALMGLLPTYAAAGLAAPLLLILLRMAQGFFAGGEVTGAATYIAESAPTGRRGFFGAFNPAAATFGLTLATACAGAVQALAGPDAMLEWAWRIPFLISVPFIVLCFWARTRIEESPAFVEITTSRRTVKTPLRQLFRTSRGPLVRATLVAYAQNATSYVAIIYLNIHLTKTLGYDPVQVHWLIAGVALGSALLMPLGGALSDRAGRKPILTLGFLGYATVTPAALHVATFGSFPLTCAAVVLGAAPFILTQSVGYPLYAEMFPTTVRYSGVSVSFNIATILGGGTAPFIAAWLTTATGSSMAPAAYAAFAAAVGLLALRGINETAHMSLSKE